MFTNSCSPTVSPWWSSSVAGDRPRADLRREARAQQRQLKQWFVVDQRPDDKCDDTSPPTGDVRRWVVDGEKFPTLTASAEYALEHGGIEKIAAQGTYAGLSGFSHPNVAFSREHRTIVEAGHIADAYRLRVALQVLTGRPLPETALSDDEASSAAAPEQPTAPPNG